jgi:hypothetical protein
MDTFKKHLHETMEERIEELYQTLMQHEKYGKLTKVHSILYQQLKCALPEDKKSALKDLDTNNTEFSDIECRYFYKHGFMDGILLAMLTKR